MATRQASGSNAIIKIAKESVQGELDTNAKNFVVGYKTGESLTATANTYSSEHITSARGASNTRNGSINVAGATSHELNFANLAVYAYASLGNVTQTDEEGKFKKVFKRAKDIPSFSIEKNFSDINDFYLFTGMKVNSFSIENSVDSLVQTSVDWIGQKVDNQATTFLNNENKITLPASNLLADIDTTIEIDNLKACTNSFSLSIENNLEKIGCIGNKYGSGASVGKGLASGEIAVSYTSNAFYNKILNETVAKVKLTYELDGKKAIIEFPKVKFSGDSVAKVDTESAIFTSVSFTALVDEELETDVIITIIDDFDINTTFGL